MIEITECVKNIGQYAFNNCSKLVTVSITAETLEKIGDSAFKNCKSLSNVYLPKSVKYIGKKAFTNTSLEFYK